MEPILNEIYVLSDTGTSLFSWSSDPNKREGGFELLSGFLSALNIFAKSEKGEVMKELTLEQTTFLFQKLDQVIFVITTNEQKQKALLQLLLVDIIEAFNKEYADVIVKFDGNVGVFENFGAKLHYLLNSFMLPYINTRIAELESNNMMQSISVISRKSGELLFTQAKQYVNKEDLGFLIPLLVRAGIMISDEMPDQELGWLLIISSKDRVMLIQPRPKVYIIEEYKTSYEFPDIFKIKWKKVKEKFQNSYFLPDIGYLKIMNKNGKVLDEISRDVDYITSIDEDSTMLLQAGSKMVKDYYKLSLSGIVIGDDNKGTFLIPMKDFYIIIRGPQEKFKKFVTILKFIDKIIN